MLARLNSFVSTPKDSPPPPSADTVDSIEDPLASVASSLASALPTVGRPPLPIPSQLEDLKSQLPIACSSCDSCEDDEEEGEFPELPSKFDMDLETEMLGDIIKPMNRLTIIATSKTDWQHEIAETPASLAFHLSQVEKRKAVRPTPSGTSVEPPIEIPGLYDTQEMSKLAVLASSIEVDEEEGKTCALLFPDFKYISAIPISKEGAHALYDQNLDPSVSALGHPASSSDEQLRSWILPYRAVVLLCSHKTRDKKCGIAAPLLESVLTSTLTLHGFDVDTTGSSLHHLPSGEEISSLSSEQEIQNLLHNASGTGGGGGNDKEVGIFKISHLSGHKYSGVMIICFPSGAILYYGRVRPRDCVAIVEKTILKGEVLAEHLRGGGNLRREKGKSLLDW
ncbi:Sucrase/ferredoxin-like-domain-containing protein [Mrakia frigida]|uniref:sucrase/ferredoxin-like domain-containing protein n=1 Tax=Mrakia frigida TaxID=29902 RepID=UPI003FCC004B